MLIISGGGFMKKEITRKKAIKIGLVATGGAILGTGVYNLLSENSIDELYGAYPDKGKLKNLKVTNPGAPKPNIIVIYCDDLGYGDVGCFGSKAVKTPNIDSLARDGKRFTDYYACNAVCAPSRAGLLTGRYPFRTGVIGNPYPKDDSFTKKMVRKLGGITEPLGTFDVREKYSARGIDEREITIAEGLKVAGYRTGMIGKWHLGDYSKNPQYNPVRHGFDEYFGVPHSNDMVPFPLYKNEKQVEEHIGDDQAKLTGLYTDEAKNFISKSDDKPFFLYFAHTFPHQPLYASEKFKGKSRAGLFGDAVEEIDWSVGELVKTLKKKKIYDNTLIIFTSDNGPWYEGSTGSLRGRKGQSYEGGFRVPFISTWKGKIPGNSKCSEPVMNLDLFSTFLSLAGVGAPEDRVIDGKNIYSLMTGKVKKSPHEALYFYHYEQLQGVRSGQWKYFSKVHRYTWPVPLDASSIINAMGKKQLGNRWPLLYDLSVDPGESYNVIETYPKKAENMKKMLTAWSKNTKTNPRGFLVK